MPTPMRIPPMAKPAIAAARAYCSEPGLGLDRTQSVDDRQLAARARHSRPSASRHRLRDLVAARLPGLQDQARGQRSAGLPRHHLLDSIPGPLCDDADDPRHADPQSGQYRRRAIDLLNGAAGPQRRRRTALSASAGQTVGYSRWLWLAATTFPG